MRKAIHPVLTLVGVQAICLALGFWFQCQLAISTTERQTIESEWSDLAAKSDRVIDILQLLPEPNLDATTFDRLIPAASPVNDPSSAAMLLTDSRGTILGSNQAASSAKWNPDHQVVLKTDRDASRTTGQRYGRIMTPIGERTAILYPLANPGREVVVYSPEPTKSIWKNSLRSALPFASGLGFFWTLSLSAVAMVVLASRLEFNAPRLKSEVNHDALRNAQDLLRTRDAVIFGLAKLAESRDAETGHHLERISLYTTRLATALRPYPKYQRIVTPTYVRLLGISSVLHDIGKVGVEDTVLLKPGRLTNEEYQHMQQHTLVAGDCLREIEERLGASNFLQTAREIALHHHERWDGTGYPYRLAEEAIPLAARIVAIADVYDALSSKRVYKEAFPHQQCVELIRSGAGTQFDPELVEIFLEIEAEFESISRRFVKPTMETANQHSSQETLIPEQILIDAASSAIESVDDPLRSNVTSHSMISVA